MAAAAPSSDGDRVARPETRVFLEDASLQSGHGRRCAAAHFKAWWGGSEAPHVCFALVPKKRVEADAAVVLCVVASAAAACCCFRLAVLLLRRSRRVATSTADAVALDLLRRGVRLAPLPPPTRRPPPP